MKKATIKKRKETIHIERESHRIRLFAGSMCVCVCVSIYVWLFNIELAVSCHCTLPINVLYTLDRIHTHSTGSTTLWMKRWKKKIHTRRPTYEWNWARFFFHLACKLLYTEEQQQQPKKKPHIQHLCSFYMNALYSDSKLFSQTQHK